MPQYLTWVREGSAGLPGSRMDRRGAAGEAAGVAASLTGEGRTPRPGVRELLGRTPRSTDRRKPEGVREASAGREKGDSRTWRLKL